MKSKRWALKIVASLTLLIFLGSDMARAVPLGGIQISPSAETPSFFQLNIPKELASIVETYEAPQSENPQMIVHIQNIHAHYEAQLKIRKLLQYLHQEYGFRLIFAEGAAQKLKPEYLHLFQEKELNLKFADHLAKEGEITGVEYYMVDGPAEVEALGIEETELYRKNYQAFKDVYGAKAQSAAFLESMDQKSEMLSSHTFSKDTRRVIKEWKKFQEGARDFLPFVKQLTQEAKQHTQLDLESLFAQVEWPQITRLLTLQKMEKELNPEAAEKEKARLLEFLKSKSLSENLVKDLEKKEKLSRFLFEQLLKEAGPKGFEFHQYPHFSLWAGYQILSAELDSKALFDEIDKLFLKTINALTLTEKEKNLFTLFQDLELLKKLFGLKLTRKEWERAEYRKEWLKPSVILGRIQSFLSPHPYPLPKGEGIENVFQTALNFYQYAHQRDEVFYQKIQAQMTERNIHKAILVTGGFHTEGLIDLFRENKVNYSVLMPRLQSGVGDEKYIENMLETRPVFDINTIELAATTQDADILEDLLRSIRYAVGRRIFNWDTFREAQAQNFPDRTREQRVKYLNQTSYAQDRNIKVKAYPNQRLQVTFKPKTFRSESRTTVGPLYMELEHHLSEPLREVRIYAIWVSEESGVHLQLDGLFDDSPLSERPAQFYFVDADEGDSFEHTFFLVRVHDQEVQENVHVLPLFEGIEELKSDLDDLHDEGTLSNALHALSGLWIAPERTFFVHKPRRLFPIIQVERTGDNTIQLTRKEISPLAKIQALQNAEEIIHFFSDFIFESVLSDNLDVGFLASLVSNPEALRERLFSNIQFGALMRVLMEKKTTPQEKLQWIQDQSDDLFAAFDARGEVGESARYLLEALLSELNRRPDLLSRSESRALFKNVEFVGEEASGGLYDYEAEARDQRARKYFPKNLRSKTYDEWLPIITHFLDGDEIPNDKARAIVKRVLLNGDDYRVFYAEYGYSSKDGAEKVLSKMRKKLIEATKITKAELAEFELESLRIKLYRDWYEQFLSWFSSTNKNAASELLIEGAGEGSGSLKVRAFKKLFEMLGIPWPKQKEPQYTLRPKWDEVFGYTLEVLDSKRNPIHQYLMADKEGYFPNARAQVEQWRKKSINKIHFSLLMLGATSGGVPPDLLAAMQPSTPTVSKSRNWVRFFPQGLLSDPIDIPKEMGTENLSFEFSEYSFRDKKRKAKLLSEETGVHVFIEVERDDEGSYSLSVKDTSEPSTNMEWSFELRRYLNSLKAGEPLEKPKLPRLISLYVPFDKVGWHLRFAATVTYLSEKDFPTNKAKLDFYETQGGKTVIGIWPEDANTRDESPIFTADTADDGTWAGVTRYGSDDAQSESRSYQRLRVTLNPKIVKSESRALFIDFEREVPGKGQNGHAELRTLLDLLKRQEAQIKNLHAGDLAAQRRVADEIAIIFITASRLLVRHIVTGSSQYIDLLGRYSREVAMPLLQNARLDQIRSNLSSERGQMLQAFFKNVESKKSEAELSGSLSNFIYTPEPWSRVPWKKVLITVAVASLVALFPFFVTGLTGRVWFMTLFYLFGSWIAVLVKMRSEGWENQKGSFGTYWGRRAWFISVAVGASILLIEISQARKWARFLRSLYPENIRGKVRNHIVERASQDAFLQVPNEGPASLREGPRFQRNVGSYMTFVRIIRLNSPWGYNSTLVHESGHHYMDRFLPEEGWVAFQAMAATQLQIIKALKKINPGISQNDLNKILVRTVGEGAVEFLAQVDAKARELARRVSLKPRLAPQKKTRKRRSAPLVQGDLQMELDVDFREMDAALAKQALVRFIDSFSDWRFHYGSQNLSSLELGYELQPNEQQRQWTVDYLLSQIDFLGEPVNEIYHRLSQQNATSKSESRAAQWTAPKIERAIEEWAKIFPELASELGNVRRGIEDPDLWDAETLPAIAEKVKSMREGKKGFDAAWEFVQGKISPNQAQLNQYAGTASAPVGDETKEKQLKESQKRFKMLFNSDAALVRYIEDNQETGPQLYETGDWRRIQAWARNWRRVQGDEFRNQRLRQETLDEFSEILNLVASGQVQVTAEEKAFAKKQVASATRELTRWRKTEENLKGFATRLGRFEQEHAWLSALDQARSKLGESPGLGRLMESYFSGDESLQPIAGVTNPLENFIAYLAGENTWIENPQTEAEVYAILSNLLGIEIETDGESEYYVGSAVSLRVAALLELPTRDKWLKLVVTFLREELAEVQDFAETATDYLDERVENIPEEQWRESQELRGWIQITRNLVRVHQRLQREEFKGQRQRISGLMEGLFNGLRLQETEFESPEQKNSRLIRDSQLIAEFFARFDVSEEVPPQVGGAGRLVSVSFSTPGTYTEVYEEPPPTSLSDPEDELPQEELLYSEAKTLSLPDSFRLFLGDRFMDLSLLGAEPVFIFGDQISTSRPITPQTYQFAYEAHFFDSETDSEETDLGEGVIVTLIENPTHEDEPRDIRIVGVEGEGPPEAIRFFESLEGQSFLEGNPSFDLSSYTFLDIRFRTVEGRSLPDQFVLNDLQSNQIVFLNVSEALEADLQTFLEGHDWIPYDNFHLTYTASFLPYLESGLGLFEDERHPYVRIVFSYGDNGEIILSNFEVLEDTEAVFDDNDFRMTLEAYRSEEVIRLNRILNRSESRDSRKTMDWVPGTPYEIGRSVLEEVSRLSYQELRGIFTDEEMTALVAWGIAYAEDPETALQKVSKIEAGLKSLKQGQTAQIVKAFRAARLLAPSSSLGAVLAQTYNKPTRMQLLSEALKLRSQTGQLLHIVVVGDESEQAKFDALLEPLRALKDINGQVIGNRLRVSVVHEVGVEDHMMEVSSQLYEQARLLKGVGKVTPKQFFGESFVQLFVGQEAYAVRELAEKWRVQNSIGIGLAIEADDLDSEELESAGYLLAMKRSQSVKLKKNVEAMLVKEDYRFYQAQTNLLRRLWVQKLRQEADAALLALAAA